MIKEEYVSFELAKKLKDAGFPQDIHSEMNTYYPETGVICIGIPPIAPIVAVCPTLTLVQKWFREEKHLDIPVHACGGCNDDGKWSYHWFIQGIFDFVNDEEWDIWDGYDTYEEALTVGIEKALEILKDKDYVLSSVL